MGATPKTTQLQIRIAPAEKAAIQRAARRAGMDMSTYVLSRVLPAPAQRWRALLENLRPADRRRNALAELNSLLAGLSAGELRDTVTESPPAWLPPDLANYVAAMVEYACAGHGIAAPAWTRTIAPLIEPVFGTELRSLRLHLLTHSPAPFRRRNIFIDTTVGGRV